MQQNEIFNNQPSHRDEKVSEWLGERYTNATHDECGARSPFGRGPGPALGPQKLWDFRSYLVQSAIWASFGILYAKTDDHKLGGKNYLYLII